MSGKMRVLMEAAFVSPSKAKLADTIKLHWAVFAAFAKDPQGQLAQLIALEHFLAGVCVWWWGAASSVPCRCVCGGGGGGS